MRTCEPLRIMEIALLRGKVIPLRYYATVPPSYFSGVDVHRRNAHARFSRLYFPHLTVSSTLVYLSPHYEDKGLREVALKAFGSLSCSPLMPLRAFPRGDKIKMKS